LPSKLDFQAWHGEAKKEYYKSWMKMIEKSWAITLSCCWSIINMYDVNPFLVMEEYIKQTGSRRNTHSRLHNQDPNFFERRDCSCWRFTPPSHHTLLLLCSGRKQMLVRDGAYG
jgi:hypothetical protein